MSANALTTLKLIIFGNSYVGKTSILLQLTDGKFSSTQSTVSADVRIVKKSYDGRIVNLAIWDTAGQERFHSLPSNLYRDVQGAVLVYDVTDYKSFKDLHVWMSNLLDYFEGTETNPVVIVLGNKIDLESRREVSRQEGANFARKNRALFLETSARTNVGVQTAFEDLVTKIMQTPGLWRRNDIDRNSLVNLNETNSMSHEWLSSCSQC